MRPLLHGVPSSDALTLGLLACPSPHDPHAFSLGGAGLRVAVAGEPAELTLRPRAFGFARALAAATLVTALFSRCCCLTPREVSSSLAALDGGRSSPVPSPVRLARAAASAAGLAE